MTTDAYEYERCHNCGIDQLEFMIRDGLCPSCEGKEEEKDG